ncbi:hypothetical protein OG689_34975 [Kitasatospora sp. NBC_00240]|uniref:WXG100 family type VII secretion target n=1 Tax=Kitasatospora sp. NBC_00240 TaxID=2903567 RepID=UPI00224C833A|nr:hypothetical protein [Kitasatospora sp. NBC_00240]MCX5214406.1 hypothetical protein [Kitasatospora sp. NBC_00240]
MSTADPGFVTGRVLAQPPASAEPTASMRLLSAGPTPSPSPGPAPSLATTRLDNPDELSASAGIAQQTATDLNDAGSKAGPSRQGLTDYAATTASQLRGFGFGGALTGATDRWQQQVGKLHDALTDVARKLEDTRRNYTHTEAANAGRFNRPN